MTTKLLLALLSACLIGLHAQAQEELLYFDAARWQESINEFAEQDAKTPPEKGGILFVGSSTIRMWNDKLAADMAPLKVVPRGFGGSTMYDLLYYFDQLVMPYRPRAIVLYEGDNDIGYFKVAPETLNEIFNDFVKKMRQELPDTRLYVISIKPSILRAEDWPAMQRANSLLRRQCEEDELLTYVDIAGAMFDKEGALKKALFLEDGLHMTEAGYAVWKSELKPLLLEREAN